MAETVHKTPVLKSFFVQTNKLIWQKRVNNLVPGVRGVPGVYTVWCGISCSFLVIITHSCCAPVCYFHLKAHAIPYHTVNTWNSVDNPSITPCSHSTVSPCSRSNLLQKVCTSFIILQHSRIDQWEATNSVVIANLWSKHACWHKQHVLKCRVCKNYRKQRLVIND